jgi:glycosyltransferase involved in cell wall biosynthesis
MKQNKIAIIGSFPRQQRVEVYNEMQKNIGENIDFKVFYLRKMPYGRYWKKQAKILHNHTFIKEKRIEKHLYLSPGLINSVDGYAPTMVIFVQYASIGAQLLMYRCWLKKIPWIFWAEPSKIQYIEDPIIKNKVLRSIFRSIAIFPVKWLSSAIWGVGKNGVKDYQKIVGDRISVKNLPLHLNLEEYYQVSQNRVEKNIVHFIFSGTLSKRKGFDIIIEVIERLSKELYTFELTIAGKGPLLKLLDNLKDDVKNKINYKGFVEFSELPSLYSTGNVILAPSRHDGWANSLVEGMASGMPSISTMQNGSAVDIVENYKNGIIMSSLTRGSLYKAMKFYIKNKDKIHSMGRYASESTRPYTHFSGSSQFLSYIKKATESL